MFHVEHPSPNSRWTRYLDRARHPPIPPSARSGWSRSRGRCGADPTNPAGSPPWGNLGHRHTNLRRTRRRRPQQDPCSLLRPTRAARPSRDRTDVGQASMEPGDMPTGVADAGDDRCDVHRRSAGGISRDPSGTEAATGMSRPSTPRSDTDLRTLWTSHAAARSGASPGRTGTGSEGPSCAPLGLRGLGDPLTIRPGIGHPPASTVDRQRDLPMSLRRERPAVAHPSRTSPTRTDPPAQADRRRHLMPGVGQHGSLG